MNPENLKIALVHDSLLALGGAERVLGTLHKIFPSAPIYTLFYNKKFTDKFLPGAQIKPTFVQKFYSVLRNNKLLTPLLPIAAESIDLNRYDVVISSSVAFSKGLILKPQTTHICYCYSPMRQIWDWHAEYKNEVRMPKIITALFQHFLRIWDSHAATRVDHFIAISENVRERIQKYYHRDSAIIYPPVNLPTVSNLRDRESLRQKTGGFFLIVSRLFKHKNIDIAIEAFNKLELPLVVIGDGPDFKKLKRIASKNIRLLGFKSDEIVQDYYANCLAFIMPQEEDFGLTPIEAMYWGKPVLALKRGGALEYIEEGVNGEFFEDPTPEVLADGVRRLKEGIEKNKYNSAIIKKTAEKFSTERFKEELMETLDRVLVKFPAQT